MSEERTVRFGYSSSENISFNGTYDTGISYEDWEEMDQKDRDMEMDTAVYEIVDIFVLGKDEDDYTGAWG